MPSCAVVAVPSQVDSVELSGADHRDMLASEALKSVLVAVVCPTIQFHVGGLSTWKAKLESSSHRRPHLQWCVVVFLVCYAEPQNKCDPCSAFWLFFSCCDSSRFWEIELLPKDLSKEYGGLNCLRTEPKYVCPLSLHVSR